MALIPEIDRLLDCDERNCRETRRFLSEFSHDLPETLNQAAVLFATAVRVFGQGLPDHFRELAAQIAAFRLDNISELAAKLEGPVPAGREAAFARARDVLDRYVERDNRGVLLARMGILYATAAVDLLRMRVTGPFGYIRVQCESLALMKLMRDTPSVAREWRRILTEADGKAFYRKYQSCVRKELRNFNLEFAYDSASATALHSRFSGISLGLEVTSHAVDGKIIQAVQVKAQELDSENPDVFLLMVLHVLRVQERLFTGLPSTCPELSDPLLVDTRIPAFSRRVDSLFEQFGERTPELVERYRAEEHGTSDSL